MDSPLRLMVYDRTCGALTLSWIAGAKLYRATGRFDATFGAASWSEALAWIAEQSPERKIAELQFWGHGNWGTALIDRRRLDIAALWPAHELNPLLVRIRDRLTGPDALWWFRTCETFGTKEGKDFARAWTHFFQCRAAGHTHVIWLAQSGLHVLGPDQEPDWPDNEGVPEHVEGAEPPLHADWSLPHLPNTISFLSSTPPDRLPT